MKKIIVWARGLSWSSSRGGRLSFRRPLNGFKLPVIASLRTVKASLVGMAVCCMPNLVLANGQGENGSWQFQTSQERVNKAVIADLVQKNRSGYYESFKSVYNYNTYIERQVNCSVSALTTGNSGSNTTAASTSSPNLSNSGSTSSNTAANAASNGLSQAGLSGVIAATRSASPTGSISNGQSNNGALNSDVSGSNTSASTGPVAANGGTTDQMLNSQQTNSGLLASSISSSTACAGPLN